MIIRKYVSDVSGAYLKGCFFAEGTPQKFYDFSRLKPLWKPTNARFGSRTMLAQKH